MINLNNFGSWNSVAKVGMPSPKDHPTIWATVKVLNGRKTLKLKYLKYAYNRYLPGWYCLEWDKMIEQENILAWMPYSEPWPWAVGMRVENPNIIND